MNNSNETTTVKEKDSGTDDFYEKYEITEEIKEEIKEEKLEHPEIKEENLEGIKNDNLYEKYTEEIKSEIKDEKLEDVEIKKEVKNTLEVNIDTAIATGALGLAGNINEL